MIVQCPNCQSKSRVDDAGAARGARVRCATCSHVFLPNTAVVQPARAAATAATPSGFGTDDTGGKTSLFTGVVSKAAVGLPDVQAPAAPGGGGDFGGNKTQAIDVSQLAAFTAKATAAPPTVGLGAAKAAKPVVPAAPAVPAAAAPAVGLSSSSRPVAPAPAPAAAQRADTGTAVQAPPPGKHPPHTPSLESTDVIGTARGARGPMSQVSRLVLGLAGLLLVCGLIFFTAARAVYAAVGLLGGQNIAISVAQHDPVRVEQVTSLVYTLADGHDALVVLGSVRNPGTAPAPKVELAFTLRDKKGVVKVQQRAPLGAILSLEELALLPHTDSAEAELRRRVQDVPPLPAQARGQKFMAVIKDPPRPLRSYTQALAVVPALPPEPSPTPAAAASAADGAVPADGAGAVEVDANMPAIVSPQAPTRSAEAPPAAEPPGHAAPRTARPTKSHRRH